MKIIKRKDPPYWTRQVSCRFCRARIEIKESDVKRATYQDYDGSYNSDDFYSWYCPCCKHKNRLWSWQIWRLKLCNRI